MRLSWLMAAAFEASHLVFGVHAVAATDTLMDGDSAQSGYLPNHNMDPAVLTGGSFGQIWSYTTPSGASEQFYAKPLVFTPSSTGRQIVLSFSEQNRIYALDAENGTLYATRDLSLDGERPFQVSDLGSCNDISGTVGVSGTPVIDPNTDTVYFWAKSYIGAEDGYQNGAYRFHAIDAVTLEEKEGFPVSIQGTPADNDNTRWFTGGTVLQRPSLNLVNGVVFAGFGGHCDQYNYTGWVVGMSASTGNLLTAYVTSGGSGAPAQDGTWNGGGGGGGIWMGGAAIASDESGRIFFATGNAYKEEDNQNIPASGRLHLDTLSECVVNMAVNPTSGAVTQSDYFEPYTYIAMDAGDRDLGAGGVSLLNSTTFSGGGVARMAIAVGKNGIAYIMNADNLGGYKLGTGGTDNIIQTIAMTGGGSVFANSGSYPLEGGYLYITPVGFATQVFSLGFTDSGLPQFTLVAQTPDISAARVGTGPPTITTYQGQEGTGVLWIVDPDAGIRAYNAAPVDGVMTKIDLPASPAVSKFQRPSFGDGRYYISTSDGQIVGFGSPVAMPLTCTSPVNFGSVAIGSSKTLNVSCVANIAITKLSGLRLGSTLYTASNSSLPPGKIASRTSFSFAVTFDLTTHQLSSGSTSSPDVTPGVQTSSVSIFTVNGVTGYATQQPVTLTGMSISAAPFITMNPLQVSFDGVVVGSAAATTGSDATFVINNVGLSNMTILGYAFTNTSVTSATSVFHNLTSTTANGVTTTVFDSNGVFTSTDMPSVGTVIEGGSSVTVSANFNSNITNSYYTMLMVYSDGGNAYTVFTGSAASSPVALLEVSNIEGGWTTIPHCTDVTDGCTTEIDFAPSYGLTQQTIQLRLTNTGGSALTITKSKPLEGTVLGATNPETDFSEGLSIVPGGSELASVLFSPGASVLNADSVFYSGTWALNTDDLTFGVHTLNFTGTAESVQTGPLAADGTAIFKYLGCYQDYVNNVRLEPEEYVNTNNTNGLCQTKAKAYGAVFGGTEYMTQCWVGSVIPASTALVADSFCTYQCAGDSTQACGGLGGYLSLYYDSTRYFPSNGTIIGASGAAPSNPATVDGYSYAGCYSDSAVNRVLTGKATSGSTMTLEVCAAFCSSYSIFGTEYAEECYCGNTLGSTSVKEANTDCSMNCAANSGEFCGAGSRLSLYIRNGTYVPSSTTSTAVSTKTSSVSGASTLASATPSTVSSGAFNALGCYTDNIVTARSLVGGATSGSSMTIELCGSYCKGLSFSYFGVEYADECYCGNAIASTATIATDGRCDMACAGNSAETCGGSYGMNIFTYAASNKTSSSSSTTSSSVIKSSQSLKSSLTTSAQSLTTSTSTSASVSATPSASSAFLSLGCYTDNTVTARALAGAASDSSSMSIELCGASCKGYTYFGVEYADECYCANTIASTSGPATDGRCDMPCAGNSAEICGGSYGLNVYSYIVSNTTSSSSLVSSTSSSVLISSSSVSSIIKTSAQSLPTSSSSSTLTRSTISATPTPSSPAIPPTIGDFTYLYCYSDNTTIRTLQAKYIATPDMTLEHCAGNCTGYVYFGVEYYSECRCGNTLTYGSYIATDGRCNMKCLGNANEICGGNNGMTLYQNLTSVAGTLSSSSSLVSGTSTSSISSSYVSSSSSLASSVQFSSSSSVLSSSTLTTLPSVSPTILSSSSSVLSSSSTQSPSLSQSTSSSSSIQSSSSLSLTSSILSSSSTLGAASSSQYTTSSSLSSSQSSSILSSTSSILSSTSSPATTSSSQPLSSSSATSSLSLSSSSVSPSSSLTSQPSQTTLSTSISASTSSSSVYTTTTLSSISPSVTANPWAYVGCSNDSTLARGLTGASTTSATSMTIEYCQAYCASKNFPLAGLEYAEECYCGYSLTNNATLGQTGCTTACSGNKSEICGGSSRLSVYNLTTFIPPSIPPSILVPALTPYNYTGCYTELTNARALSSYSVTNTTGMTLDLCVSTCAGKGYGVAGVEYGSQCFCGNVLSALSTQVPDAQCEVLLCPGNAKEWCSAGNRLVVYTG